jgi:hypothetical protein
MDDEMAAAQSRDYKEMARMEMLMVVIEDFLDGPPRRCNPQTIAKLQVAHEELVRACELIVLAWN